MNWLAEFAGDVRYGLRLLWRAPVFTIVAVLSLALGIGGATTVFVLVNAIVLRALPVPGARDLFLLRVATRQEHSDVLSAPAFARGRDALAGRVQLCAATGVTGMQVHADGAPAASRGNVQLVSGEYFDVLRQRAQLGRLLQPADSATVGGQPVAVVSDGYWRRQLDASPDAVGRTLTINGAPFTIVGVTAPGFFGTTLGVRNPDAWIPYTMQAAVRYASNMSDNGGDETKPWTPQPQISWLTVFARVPAAVPAGTTEAVITTVLQQEADALRSPGAGPRGQQNAPRAVLESAAGGVSSLRRNTSAPLLLLLAMVGVLLAIACGNVAGLLLARSASREREVAIRLSIGASRVRIVRQLLAESLLLGGGAGVIGVTMAVWLRDWLVRLFVPGATAIDLDTAMDGRVLGFAVGVSLLTGLACGILPALRGTGVSLTESLKQHARTVGAGRRTLLAGRALVAVQMAFCLLLLVVAGLFARSLQSLVRTDVGFDRAHLLVANVDVRSAGYAPQERIAMYNRLIERLAGVPGVVSVSLSENGPLNGSSWRSGMTVEGHTPAPGERVVTNEEAVAGPYFQTVGLRLIDGRLFEPQDRREGSRATIVNETMARRYFPGQSAIGKRWAYGDSIDADAFTIVGVVEDARYLQVRDTPPTMAYHPAEFDPEATVRDLEIRTSGAPAALTQTVRDAIAEAEPRLPIVDVVPLAERVTRELSKDRLVAELTSVFGALALLLAALGLYGTISYGISRRVPELGMRMALGADRGSVLRMVMREALALVAAGGVLGLLLSFAAGRSIGTLLYGIPAADLVSYAGALGVLVAICAAAAFLPALRASRIDPMRAIGRS